MTESGDAAESGALQPEVAMFPMLFPDGTACVLKDALVRHTPRACR